MPKARSRWNNMRCVKGAIEDIKKTRKRLETVHDAFAKFDRPVPEEVKLAYVGLCEIQELLWQWYCTL